MVSDCHTCVFCHVWIAQKKKMVVNVPDIPYGKTELSVPCQVETAIPATTLLIDSSKLPPSCLSAGATAHRSTGNAAVRL